MISVIIPAFNEQDNLEILYQKLEAVALNVKKYHFEFIFIDDGSTDETPTILQRLHDRDQRVHILRFARNFGSHAAIAAGLMFCQGESAIVLAADMQDPPELIVKLVDKWEQGGQIVWAVRTIREKENFLTRASSRIYYFLMDWLTGIHMPPLGTDVFLADRRVIDAFRKVGEKHTSVFMALAWLGFKQVSIGYVKEARYAGTSKWTFRKKLKLTIDSLLAFSDIYIRYMSVLGVLTAFIGFIFAMSIFWTHVNGTRIDAWSSLIVIVLVLGGMQMIMLGILGEYLWRTFDESRKRPRYILEYGVPENPEKWSLRERTIAEGSLS